MKSYILTLFVLFTIGVQAQHEVEVRYSNPEWDVLKNKNIATKHRVNIYSKTRNGKRLVESLSFGEKGLSENHEFYKRNGTLKKSTLYQFNDSNRVTHYQTIRRNKIYQFQHFSYSNLIQLNSSKFYYKDTLEPASTTIYEYYPNNKYKSYCTYDKNNKQGYRYEYDYYENGSRKETRFLYKGKLKHTWVYDCDWKGELTTSKTDKICKNRVYDADSSFTEIYESTAKGKSTKSIIKSARDGRVLESINLNAKGKQQYKFVYTYNDSQKLVKRVSYKGNNLQPESIELYEYNADASLASSVRLNGNGDIKYRREFSYN